MLSETVGLTCTQSKGFNQEVGNFALKIPITLPKIALGYTNPLLTSYC